MRLLLRSFWHISGPARSLMSWRERHRCIHFFRMSNEKRKLIPTVYTAMLSVSTKMLIEKLSVFFFSSTQMFGASKIPTQFNTFRKWITTTVMNPALCSHGDPGSFKLIPIRRSRVRRGARLCCKSCCWHSGSTRDGMVLSNDWIVQWCSSSRCKSTPLDAPVYSRRLANGFSCRLRVTPCFQVNCGELEWNRWH